MGFRFRKSIDLGGFRINLSKTGIGYSFGAKGLRYTHKAGGGGRSTVSIPGTGISYVKDYPAVKNHPAHKKSRTVTAEKEKRSAHVSEEIKDDFIESSPSEMIDQLNRTDKLARIFSIVRVVLPVIGFLFLSIVVAIVSKDGMIPLETGEVLDGTAAAIVCGVFAALCLGGSIFFFLQKIKIDLFYDFSEDEEFEREYLEFTKGFSVLQTSETIWEIRDNVPREQAKVAFVPLDSYICTDLDIKTMKLLAKKILFLPDIIAIKQQNKWVGIPYTEIEIALHDETMEETYTLSDTLVLSERWLHEKKDGTKDMRYSKDNYLIYTCLYGKLMLTSKKGLNVCLLCSSNKNAQIFSAALERYITFLKT